MRKPARYHLLWFANQIQEWRESPRRTLSTIRYEPPFRATDCVTGQVVQTNFGVREEAHFAITEWPLLKKLLEQNKAWPAYHKEQQRKRRISYLRAQEKAWVRKMKYGTTRLRKIRAALKRYDKDYRHQTGPATDHQHGR